MVNLRKTVSLTATGLVAATACLGKAAPQTRPNIIIIMTDQQRWDALSYSGNKAIRTPNLDRLAASGVWFKAAVTQCPVSAPARASVLTGTCIEKTTVRTNADAGKKNQCPFSTFDQILADNGYHPEYYGKFHSPTKMTLVYKDPDQGGLSGSSLIVGEKLLYKQLTDQKVLPRPLVQGEQFATGCYSGIPYKPDPMDRRYGLPPQPASTSKKGGDDDDGEGGEEVHGCLELPADITLTAFTVGRALEALDRVKKSAPFTLTCSNWPE